MSEQKISRTLTEDEYREFNDRVAILSGKGYDIPFEVEWNHHNHFRITIHGKHDFDELDKMCDENI
tara:strand:+ start:239 stop:436 length:198 start_codon:yes stop_codon:yes gene_type:complete